jgi:hypothetical protein
MQNTRNTSKNITRVNVNVNVNTWIEFEDGGSRYFRKVGTLPARTKGTAFGKIV